MRAAVCRAFGAPFEIEELKIDDPAPDEVRVAIRACAVCHSDLIYADGGWGGPTPVVFGHEAAGVVEAAGAESGFRPGERVLATMVRSCGACGCCSEGLFGACTAKFPRDARPPLRDAAGAPVAQGLKTAAFADLALLHRSQLVRLPGDLPFDLASVLACGVITGYGAVANTAAIRPGASVGVIGVGGVGMNSVQAAALRGAGAILAIDPNEARLEQAQRLGATAAINPEREDVAAAARAANGGRGLNYVFVAAGVREAIEQAPELLTTGGCAVLVGIPPSGVEAVIDPVRFVSRALRLLGSKLHADLTRDVPALIAHHRAGRLDLASLVTARFPFERINEAMDAARAGRGLRNVVMFGEAR